MAAAIELVASRRTTVSIDNPSVDLVYKVLRTEDDAAVRVVVEQTIPFLYNLTSSLGVQQLVFQSYEIDHRGNGIWNAVAKYGKKEPQKTGDPENGKHESSFSFDTTGGTRHVKHSIRTVQRYGTSGKTPPDFKGLIGVNDDKVEGCDVVAPAFAFSESHRVPSSFVTGAYKNKIYLLTGKVNAAQFTRADGQTFAPGECQFLGASGSKRGTEGWEITYKFTASVNASGLVIGDITGIAKEGFHYLWVRWQEVENAKTLVKQPESIHVEQVVEYGHFGDLKIGE